MKTQTLFFDSFTPDDSEFLRGVVTNPVTISGLLTLPSNMTTPAPIVILLHGSGGRGALIDQWARRFVDLGIATFSVDSFTGRGLTSVRSDQSLLGRLIGTLDAFNALDFIASHSEVDSSRAAVMGFSRGGQGALYAALTRFQKMHLNSANKFVGYIALYPNCTTRYLEDDQLDGHPVRIHHGDADDYNPVSATQSYVDRLNASNADVKLTRYPDAHHVFDWDGISPPQFFPDAQSALRCRINEVRPGLLISESTGAPFNYSDECVMNGATMGYSPEAVGVVVSEVTAFLQSVFGLKRL